MRILISPCIRRNSSQNGRGFLNYLPLIVMFVGALLPAPACNAQDRLATAPGYGAYRKLMQDERDARFAVTQGAPTQFGWTADGKLLTYKMNGKSLKFDLATGAIGDASPEETTNPAQNGGRSGRNRGGGPGRGRQSTVEESPDKKFRAAYKDRNLSITEVATNAVTPVTTDGSAASRIKYGTASWVYGEELEQRTAFWWAPDSKSIAYYKFDESKVLDYITLSNQLAIQDGTEAEAYPKSGAPNPIADIYLYNVETKKSIRIDTRDGKPADNDTVGYYVYNVRWSPDGKELLFNRTDRKQKILDIAAANPASGMCRTIVHESNVDGYTENLPKVTFLADNHRFLVESSRSGFKNLYMYDLSGKMINQVTANSADLGDIVRVDEKLGQVFYTARDGDNAMKLQFHRVSLDGKGDKCLTDRSLLHTAMLSTDGKYFVDTAESHDKAPTESVIDYDGKVLKVLFTPDTSKIEALKIPAPEYIVCKAADGKTDLYGMLHKPIGFDPTKKYPLLISTYGGPTVEVVSERYGSPNSLTALGFLEASFDNRGTPGRGRAFEQATYNKLGVVDVDDQAACITFLKSKGFVDASRVGIYGTSYGGYASLMALLRHPEVYTAACAMSSVTDWRNYDTVYTERYMGLPQENTAGYNAGAAKTYAQDLKGKLMLYFGTADDNVHPSNSLQIIGALQRAHKGFEMQIGPDQGHTALNNDRMLEFFMDAFGMWKPQ